MTNISLYPRVSSVDSTEIIDFDIFLDNIKSGFWEKDVFNVRAGRKEKKTLPSVTISGTFASRKDAAIIDHSGFICIDIDKCDPSETKSILCADDYVYSSFTSCSGNGLAVIFKINPKKHRESFSAIGSYLLKNYNIVIDPTSINPSRARFVSCDPDLYLNPKAKKWTEYLPKEKKRVETQVIFVKSDFDAIIHQLQTRHIDITNNYEDWLHIGFGLAEKFGESGRDYFHAISAISSKYNHSVCDKQYTACLKAQGSGRTIATLYWLVKNAGIETYSVETKEIIKLSAAQKRSGGMNDEAIAENLKKFSDLPRELIDEVVPQVQADTIQADVSEVEILQAEVSTNYNIRRNVITMRLEFIRGDKWVTMEMHHMNSIYLKIKRNFAKVTFDMISRIINSEETPDFNPIMHFLESNSYQGEGHIKKLSDTITSGYGITGTDREYFIKKWLVGIISSIYGKHSPLMLVLVGSTQNTGKTQWFRRLLPEGLKIYYAESKLDKTTDDEILMTQKLIIMDDEMGGKSKRESSRLKELTSKQTFSLRVPYGHGNVDLNRLACLCGTSNEDGILNDPTGNRRIIPIHVASVNHNLYNSINKTALFMEAHHLYHAGFNCELTKDDINLLNGNTTNFEAVSMEEELIFKHFKIPNEHENWEYFMASEIVVHIENMTRQRIAPQKIGAILQKHGQKRFNFKNNGIRGMGYRLIKIEVVRAGTTVNFDQNSDIFGKDEKSENFNNSDFDPELPF